MLRKNRGFMNNPSKGFWIIILFCHLLTVMAAASIGAVTFSKQPAIQPVNADLLNNSNPTSDSNAQFKWPGFTGEVVIEVDLAEIKWVSNIELFANAAPKRNIDRVIIETSDDKSSYRQVDVINCDDSRLNEIFYSLKSKSFSEKVRYVRLSIYAPFIEVPIAIHHINIVSTLDKPIEKSQLTSVTSENLADVNGTCNIQNDIVKVIFNSSSGEISGIYKAGSGKRLVNKIATWSMLQTKDVEKEIVADDVVESFRSDLNKMVFKCIYAGDKRIRMIKTYTLESNRIIKRVDYDGSQIQSQDFTFITPAERLLLPQERLQQVVFAGGDPWYGPRVWPQDIIAKTRQRGSGVSHCMIVIDKEPSHKNSLALYRRRVNDRFCWPVSSVHNYETYNSLSYYPDGGLVPVSTFALHNQKASYETDIIFFEGQESEFVQKFSNVPDVADAYSKIKRPEWTKEVSCNLWLDPMSEGSAVKKLDELLKMTARGDILVVLNQPFIWGSFGETPEFLNIWGARVYPDDYKKLIVELKSMSPRVKVALYSWIWTIAPKSEFFKEFKDCANVLDKSGQPFNAWPGIDTTHLRRMIDKPSVDALKEQYKKMVESYGVDYVYLDGGIGGSSQIDWQRGTADQDYDWQEFYCFMRDLSEKVAKSGVCFNCKSNPIADFGIAEMALGAFKGDTAYIMNYMWGGKLQERIDPNHRVIPCYWGFSDPWYSNICVGLGMIPHIEAAGLSSVETDFIRLKSHVITVAREMVGTIPNDVIAGLYPYNRGQKISGYALFRGNTDVISLMNSSDQVKDAKVELPGKLTSSRDKSIFVWQNNFLPILSKPQIYSEFEQVQAYDGTTWYLQHSVESKYLGTTTANHEKINVTLNPTQLSILGLSNSDAVISAIDGLPTQLKMSNVLNVSVQTEYKNDLVNIQVSAPETVKNVDLWCVLPRGRSASSSDANVTGFFWQNDTCIACLKTCGSGSYSLKLTPTSLKDEIAVQLTCDAIATSGEVLKVEIKSAPKNICWNIINEKQQIMAVLNACTGKSEIKVPSELHAGNYRLRLVSAISNEILWEQSIKIINQIEKTSAPATSTEAKYKLQPVKDSLILNAAIQENSGACESSYDLAKRIITAKTPRRPTSAWGFSSAGFELKNVRWLKLRASSNISSAYCIEHRYGRDKPFAGLVVDYKTADGYTKRVAFNCGLNEYHWASPDYGKAAKADENISIADWITSKETSDMALDLKEWAPSDWSGQCWINACLGNILPDRWISFEIVDIADKEPKWSNEILKEGSDVASLPAFPSPYTVSFVNDQMVIDGLGNEKSWMAAQVITDFRFLHKLNSAEDCKTTVKMLYDPNNLYILFQCLEPSGSRIITLHGKEGSPWADDSVEIYLCEDVNKPVTKVIIGADGSCYADHNLQIFSGVETKTVINGSQWSVEAKIALSQLNMFPKKGKIWKANVCRNRPRREGEPFGRETISWARIKAGTYSQPAFFAELKFN
jgi:hypothetical protein